MKREREKKKARQKEKKKDGKKERISDKTKINNNKVKSQSV